MGKAIRHMVKKKVQKKRAAESLTASADPEDGIEVVPVAASCPSWEPLVLDTSKRGKKGLKQKGAPKSGKKGRKQKGASEGDFRQKELSMLEEVLNQEAPTVDDDDEEHDLKGGDIIATPGDKDRKVFVGGLPWDASAETVRKDFAECGDLASFDMPTNADGQPMGVAFIVYRTQEGVDNALAFDGDDYFGRKIRVKLSKPPRQGGQKGKGKGKGKGKVGKVKGKGKGSDGRRKKYAKQAE